MNNSILLSTTPKRIVCLVPSITELLVDLNLEDKIIGITKFCIEPFYIRKKCTIVGGTKKLNLEKIKELNPDFIIANKEENSLEDIVELKKSFKIWISDVKTIEDNHYLIEQLGKIFKKEIEAERILTITNDIIKNLNNKIFNKKVLYLIWKNPFMTVGYDTFIHEIISKIGLNNCIKETRYPIIDLNNYKNVEFVFLSSEPYPFNENDLKEIQECFPDSKVFLVDGTYFSWYGSRISKSKEYFEKFIAILE